MNAIICKHAISGLHIYPGVSFNFDKKAFYFFQHNKFLLLYFSHLNLVKQFYSEINYEALNMFILQKLFFTYMYS